MQLHLTFPLQLGKHAHIQIPCFKCETLLDNDKFVLRDDLPGTLSRIRARQNVAQRMEWRIASHRGEIMPAASRNKVRKAESMEDNKRHQEAR